MSPVIEQVSGRLPTTPVVESGVAANEVPLETPAIVVATRQAIAVTFCVALSAPAPVAVVVPTALGGRVVGCGRVLPVRNETVFERSVPEADCSPRSWKK